MKSRMRFSVLASGSSGNAFYVETDNAKILIDAGLSCRNIVRRLEQVGLHAEELDALIITHEHADHIKGAGPLSRRFNLPIYLNRKTLERGRRILGNLASPVIIRTGQSMTINDVNIDTFTKCHDAADPFGVIISFNGARIALATDLGRSTRLVEDRLKGCQALIIEFNYDQIMLDEGPYPLDLKKRIKGADGHLSNRQGADILGAVTHKNLKFVMLAHLSETNNYPTKAYKEAEDVLKKHGPVDARILISQQDEPSPVIEL